MTRKRKISFSLAIPDLLGTVILFSLITTCQRFEPELILEITTNPVIMLPNGGYQLTGSVISFGHEPITQHGFCWATTSNPTTAANTTQLGVRDSKGAFSSTISGLTLSTIYYVRAYAISSEGTEYGKERSFTTPAPTLPAVTTSPITGFTETSAIGGGNVTDDGGVTVTARGVCWSTSQNPTVTNSKTTDGNGTGSFTSSLTGLTCGTTYYVRAYATNSAGTAYGLQQSFSTSQCPADLATVTTSPITGITGTSAQGGGNITDDGGVMVTVRGVCWSTSQNPTVTNSKTTDGSGTGSFTSSLTGLSPITTYYVRAYATNSVGTGYGNEQIFITDNPDITGQTGTLTDIDGNVYNWIGIGKQAWMAENLKVTHYASGTSIPLIEEGTDWDALGYTDKAYCWYDNSTTNRDTYGGLYTWTAATNGAASSSNSPSGVQGVCPAGWHLPSDEEWKQMEMYLGMSRSEADGEDFRGTDEGGKLKEEGTTHWQSPNEGATNASGFTALPGGYRDGSGSFFGVGNGGVWWSSSEVSTYFAWVRDLVYNGAGVFRYDYDKDSGFSVRCVRDK